jgi:hypothetical protein
MMPLTYSKARWAVYRICGSGRISTPTSDKVANLGIVHRSSRNGFSDAHQNKDQNSNLCPPGWSKQHISSL